MFWRRRTGFEADWIVVGLGNPGEEYRWTPHNLGFLTVDTLARKASVRVSRPEESALVGRGTIGGRETVLAKPLTYMNRSGGPVKRLLRRYAVPRNACSWSTTSWTCHGECCALSRRGRRRAIMV